MKPQEMAICLWFDSQAEEAVNFYTSVFKDSKIGIISKYGKEGFEHHQKPEGSIMSIDFKLNGMNFTALNGGPMFKFNESVSIMVYCDTQEEIDYYWDKLSEKGETSYCGWLKDQFGVSWQIIPSILIQHLANQDKERSVRMQKAVFQMTKFEIDKLIEAYNG